MPTAQPGHLQLVFQAAAVSYSVVASASTLCQAPLGPRDTESLLSGFRLREGRETVMTQKQGCGEQSEKKQGEGCWRPGLGVGAGEKGLDPGQSVDRPC